MPSRRIDIRSLAQTIGPGARPARAIAFSRWAWMAAFATIVMVAGVTYYLLGGSSKPSKYVIAEVSRGPVVRAVTATGTINPVTTVPVGSYVSGPIIAIYADFNSPGKEGQRVSRIDAPPLQVKPAESQALLE